MDWFTEGGRRAASDRVRADLFHAAEALGAHHVKIGGSLEDDGNKVWPRETLAREFAAICAEARNAGTLIALEPMPFTNLRSIRQGVEMIRDSGATNGGLMLDIWHLARGGVDFDDITWMPKELIYWVEIDDADPEIVESLWIDTIHHRKLPGEGSLDIEGFLGRVFDTGYSGPFGVEIISLTHRKLSLEEQARRVYETSMRQFELALAARA
jgi:sugar phosphate isomerase/epimerase